MRFVETLERTVQGEGKYVGSIMSLVRFSGCNHDCDFCDTDFSEDKVQFDTNSQLLESLPMQKVMVTGGEPTIHPNFQTLVEMLLSNGREVHIESNGYMLDDWAMRMPGSIVWTISPKLYSSGNGYEMDQYYGVKNLYSQVNKSIKDCFLKFVIGKKYLDDMDEAMLMISELGVSMDDVWFQPVDNDLEIYRLLVDNGPMNAHYGLQLHKMVGVK